MNSIPEWMVTVAIGAAQACIGIGIYIAIIRQTKKDVADLRKEVNGVGGRGRQDEAIEDARYLALGLTFMVITDDPEKRKWMAEFLFRAGPRLPRPPQ
jgi:hypothetical protein